MLTTDDILKATGGELIAPASKRFSGVSTDTRTVDKGQLFVALKGDRFDAHDFLTDAFQRGASGVVVEKGRAADVVIPAGKAVIAVTDTLRALQDIAAYHRRSMEGLVVVGVTGTNGKTTTKEMLASILSVKGPVHKTTGNLNNEIGVPLTLLGLKKEHWAAVVEMGMSGMGEIARLAEISAPVVGVITNIGPGHLEKLGSLEGVAKAKGELIDALPPDGKAALNLDDARLRDMIIRRRDRTVTFGLRPGASVTATAIVDTPSGVSFKLTAPGGSVTVTLPVLGAHNVENALAASAAATALGFGVRDIKHGLERFSPAKMRMEVTEVSGAKVINDAYNANPASMAAALNALAAMREYRRVAVLGDMLELGGGAAKAHFEAGRLAGSEDLSLLILMGKNAPDAARGAVEAGMDERRVFVASNHEEAAGILADRLRQDDVVLVKGSRGMKMERVIEALKTRRRVA